MTLDQVFNQLNQNILQLQQGYDDFQGEIARLKAEVIRLNSVIDTPYQTTTEQQVVVNRVNELSVNIASAIPHA